MESFKKKEISNSSQKKQNDSNAKMEVDDNTLNITPNENKVFGDGILQKRLTVEVF